MFRDRCPLSESFPQRGDRKKSQGAFFSARGVITPIETHPKYPLGETLTMRGLSLFFKFLTLSYLFWRRDYRKEIERNYYHLFGKKEKGFWRRNGLRLAEDLCFMLKSVFRDRCPLSVVEIPIEGLGERSFPQRGDRKKSQGAFFSARGVETPIERGLGKNQKGAIFLTLHFGVWEILPVLFRRLGFKVAIAVGRQRSPVLAWLIERIRERGGVKTTSSVFEMLSLLQRGYLLGFAVDNTRRVERVVFPEWEWLGIAKTPFLLAERAKVPLYSIFGILNRSKELSVAIRRISSPAEFSQIALAYVKKYPEQFVFWGK